jgi:hypothetical protein
MPAVRVKLIHAVALLRRLLRLPDCDDVSSKKLEQFLKRTRIGADINLTPARRSWLVVGLFPHQRTR